MFSKSLKSLKSVTAGRKTPRGENPRDISTSANESLAKRDSRRLLLVYLGIECFSSSSDGL
jgi:hypothetical protein